MPKINNYLKIKRTIKDYCNWTVLKAKYDFLNFFFSLNSPIFETNAIYLFVYLSIFPNPSARARYDTRSIFKRSLTGLNSEFSFSHTSCLTKAKELSLPYYLPIAGGRIIGFIPFPRVLVLCEMQSVSSRIWTPVTMSISYDDNHYTTGTSSNLQSSLLLCGTRPNKWGA